MAERKYGYLANLGFATMDPKQVAGSLREIGYQTVEWTLGHFNPRAKSPAELQGVIDAASAEGIETSEIVVQQDLVSLDADERQGRIELSCDCIRAAADVGVNVVNVFSGPAPWDPAAPVVGQSISEPDAWGMVVDGFERMLAVAEECKVYIAVEAVFGMLCRDYYTMRELFARVSSPYLAVNMDPSHYGLYRNDIDMVVEAFGPQIQHVHLKDVVGVPGMPGDEFLFPLLGEGRIDWPGFYASLDRAGYDGTLSVEFESFDYYRKVLGDDPIAAARLSMEQLEALETS